MPQIAHFSSRKLKSSLAWEGGNLPPTHSPRSVATLPRKDCAPLNFLLAHYATATGILVVGLEALAPRQIKINHGLFSIP